jgi:uncharacterized phage-associated protein
MIKKESVESNYTPSHVANYFLWRSWSDGMEINAMKLIKLIYIAYGWNLAVNEEKLFDEKILAWAYGPVMPSIYHEFKRFGNKPIKKDEYSAEFDIETGDLICVPIIPKSDDRVLRVLNAVWNSYKDKSGVALSRVTHSEDGSWCKAYKKGVNTQIGDGDIKRKSMEALCSFAKKDKSFDGNGGVKWA